MRKQQIIPIYSAGAVSNSTGEKLGFTIYEVGERQFKISCGQRRPHLFESKNAIDKEQMRKEIETAYDAKEVMVSDFKR